jgi:hypothetical protein
MVVYPTTNEDNLTKRWTLETNEYSVIVCVCNHLFGTAYRKEFPMSKLYDAFEEYGMEMGAASIMNYLHGCLSGNRMKGIKMKMEDTVPVALVLPLVPPGGGQTNIVGFCFPPKEGFVALVEDDKLRALHEAAKTTARALRQTRAREYAALNYVSLAKVALEKGIQWYEDHFQLGNYTGGNNKRVTVTGEIAARPIPMQGEEFKKSANAAIIKLGLLTDNATVRATVQTPLSNASSLSEGGPEPADGAPQKAARSMTGHRIHSFS